MNYCSKCQPKYNSEMWDEADVFDICHQCGKACINGNYMLKANYKGISIFFSHAMSIFRAV